MFSFESCLSHLHKSGFSIFCLCSKLNTSHIMVLTYDLLEDGHKDDFTMNDFFLFFIK